MLRSGGIVMVVVVVALMVLQASSAQGLLIGSTTSYQCPSVECGPFCTTYLGIDGCEKCDCNFTCENVDCLDGHICEMQERPCQNPPCPVDPVCVPMATTTPCPMVTCAKGCVLVTRPNGCSRCACPPTCENVTCSEDEECELEPVICITFPCFPVPGCVPKNSSCTGTPNTDNCNDSTYRWSYNSSTNTCERFRHYGCTPSPNTFLSQKACEAKCRASDICGTCGDYCYAFVKKNQRTRCICPNPCKDFNCTGDDVCRLREVQCVKEPCDPIPYCTQDFCPTQPPCVIRCEYGLKTDENGCQLCDCCEEPKQT